MNSTLDLALPKPTDYNYLNFNDKKTYLAIRSVWKNEFNLAMNLQRYLKKMRCSTSRRFALGNHGDSYTYRAAQATVDQMRKHCHYLLERRSEMKKLAEQQYQLQQATPPQTA